MPKFIRRLWDLTDAYGRVRDLFALYGAAKTVGAVTIATGLGSLLSWAMSNTGIQIMIAVAFGLISVFALLASIIAVSVTVRYGALTVKLSRDTESRRAVRLLDRCNVPFASEQELRQKHLQGRQVFLHQIAILEEPTNMIESRTFTNCLIRGPAAITPKGEF